MTLNLPITAILAFLDRGGPAMWAIAALSVATLALILWKALRLAAGGAWSGGVVTGRAVALWAEGKGEAAQAALGARASYRARLARAAMAARSDASLTSAAAEAETVHAHAHLRALKGVKSTKENLQQAIAGETHEFKSMYPAMIETAKAEGNKEAERTFHFANEVEKIHAGLYQQMLDNLDSTKESYSYYVCPVCGYTSEKEAPETCPVCGAKGKMFKKVD